MLRRDIPNVVIVCERKLGYDIQFREKLRILHQQKDSPDTTVYNLQNPLQPGE